MKYGIEHENEAAEFYSKQFGHNVYPVGLVINPSAPYLGASPHRRVYDPSEDPPWGLLEIKCPQAESYVSLPYLKVNRNGLNCLKKAHEYYFQQMGCMGITGSALYDFFVYCENDNHHERIYFDQ